MSKEGKTLLYINSNLQLHVTVFWKYYNILWCGESLIHCITGIDSFSLCMQSRENFLILRASLYECSGLQLIKIACVGYFTGRINMPLLIYFADMIGMLPYLEIMTKLYYWALKNKERLVWKFILTEKHKCLSHH